MNDIRLSNCFSTIFDQLLDHLHHGIAVEYIRGPLPLSFLTIPIAVPR
jgi:hypothetical protein